MDIGEAFRINSEYNKSSKEISFKEDCLARKEIYNYRRWEEFHIKRRIKQNNKNKDNK